MRTDHVIALLADIRGRAHEFIAAELERRGHPGLAPSHGAILARLYEQGPLPMGVLAQGVGRRKNTLTTLVRKLEAAGYVQRQPDPRDSRITRVALTAKGEAFRPDFSEVSRILLERTWGSLDRSRQEALVAGLEEILRNLT